MIEILLIISTDNGYCEKKTMGQTNYGICNWSKIISWNGIFERGDSVQLIYTRL